MHAHRPSATACRCWCLSPDRPDLFARICGYFDGAGFSIQDAKIHTSRSGYALDTFQVAHPNCDTGDASCYRDLISLIEHQLAMALNSDGPLPEPSRGRLSRRVKSFPITPRADLVRPDERAQRWLLSVSTSDRTGPVLCHRPRIGPPPCELAAGQGHHAR